MGAQPADIEREIEEQRQRLGPRIAKLRDRVQSDIQEARAVAKEQVSRAQKRASRIAVIVAGGVAVVLAVGFIYSRVRRRRTDDFYNDD
jgi:hypothetical protein